MNHSDLSETNSNIICEALGCDAKATTKVAARVGLKETIFLFLCENCKPKFAGGKRDD